MLFCKTNNETYSDGRQNLVFYIEESFEQFCAKIRHFTNLYEEIIGIKVDK